jgi:hypothetical protein
MILVSIASLILGIFIRGKAELVIEIQRRFYLKINWKIEPISMEKEIHNTKLMGSFLVILSLSAIIYRLLIR